jgi:hypothetical protein
MSYHHSTLGEFGFFKSKREKSPPPEAPPAEEILLAPKVQELPTGPLPEDPADYVQDPKCSEGQTTASVLCEGADCDPNEYETECVSDPIYEGLVAKLEGELAEIEREQRYAEEAAAREQLRIKQEAIRMQQEEEIALAREEEAEQIQMLAIYGIGGLGVLTVITLLIKALLK